MNPEVERLFALDKALRIEANSLVAQLAEVSRPAEHVSLTVSSDDLCMHGSPGEVRKLGTADKPLAERFPPPASKYQPPLSQFVEWATNDPERQVVYGLVIEREIVSFVQFNLNIDNIWEVGMIRTGDSDKRKGYAKAVLAHASAELLERGFVPMYDVAATNVASLRTAQAGGYREVCRRFACEGRIRRECRQRVQKELWHPGLGPHEYFRLRVDQS